MTEWLSIIALVLFGIGLIIVEIIFVPGTTIVGILGFLCGGYGIYLGYSYFGESTGHIVLVSSVALAFVCIFYSFKSGAWKKFANSRAINSRVNEGLTANLNIGDMGTSVSSLKPVGKALFNDKEYEVSSLGNFILENAPVKIIKIEKNKIFVEPNN